METRIRVKELADGTKLYQAQAKCSKKGIYTIRTTYTEDITEWNWFFWNNLSQHHMEETNAKRTIDDFLHDYKNYNDHRVKKVTFIKYP
jgi:hypothetical protein